VSLILQECISEADLDSFKNEYGLQVKMPAKPTFPVEYLYVNVSYSTPETLRR
jgi:hypothetical protein